MSGNHLAAWTERVVELAEQAGRVLADHAPVRTEFKGRRELVTAADRAAEQVVVQGLRETFPDHGILAEEGVLTPKGRADRDAEWIWVVDPLDGTTNFIHGIPFFCVAIGLVHRGEPVLGVVHAPVLRRTYRAWQGGGAFRGPEQLQVSGTATVRDALLATGFSYDRHEEGRDDNLARVAAVLPVCRDLRRLGSAELDLCQVAEGTFDGYWELDLMPYDVIAGAVVVREAGGQVTDLRGGDAWTDGKRVLATNGAIHRELLGLVGEGHPRQEDSG